VKKLIGIVFLSTLILQVTGSYIYFIARLTGIRQEMRNQLKNKPDDQLTLLILTKEEYLKAKVDDQELKVNEKMYDIARVVFKKDNVLVYALHDNAEDNLLAFLNELVDRSSKDKKPVPSSLLSFINMAFICPGFILPLPEREKDNPNTAYQLAISEVHSHINAPPPKISYIYIM
jgi:hypothetical protein